MIVPQSAQTLTYFPKIMCDKSLNDVLQRTTQYGQQTHAALVTEAYRHLNKVAKRLLGYRVA
jgi:hypothetical protein